MSNLTLNEVLERARYALRNANAEAHWGDVAQALLEMMVDLDCGAESPVVVRTEREDEAHLWSADWPCVKIYGDLYEPDAARALATAILRTADECDEQRKLLVMV